MSDQMTATEVQIRIEEWERVNQPKYEASINRMLEGIWGETINIMYLHVMDQYLQQQRMTDDGCPL